MRRSLFKAAFAATTTLLLLSAIPHQQALAAPVDASTAPKQGSVPNGLSVPSLSDVEHQQHDKDDESRAMDWSCKTTKQHPKPVIILHGLISYGFQSWSFMTDQLTAAGYCVFQLKYGQIPGMPFIGGLRDIRESAEELEAFVDKVLEATGAEKVDLIAHSEGTVVSRWYVKFLRGKDVVDSVVSVAPVGRGTSLLGLVGVSKLFGWFNNATDIVQQFCTSCIQLLQGSDLLNQLYADGQEAVPGVRYLNLVTRNDQVVTPFSNGLMKIELEELPDDLVSNLRVHSDEGNAKKTTIAAKNLIIEDHCPDDKDHSNHFGIFQSSFVYFATDAFFSGKTNPEESVQCSMPSPS
ncbi:Alpha/Beta hydrolase protein [Dissophora ornata]|nr:Alpha/Beta hydrolase protein [Dissophora ornata]